MLDFLKKHWFILTLSVLALAAIVATVVFPPALLILGLASSSAFAALGAAAIPVAIATVAAAAAAAVFVVGGLIKGAVSLISWLFNRGSQPGNGGSGSPTPEIDGEDHGASPDAPSSSARLLSSLGGNTRPGLDLLPPPPPPSENPPASPSDVNPSSVVNIRHRRAAIPAPSHAVQPALTGPGMSTTA